MKCNMEEYLLDKSSAAVLVSAHPNERGEVTLSLFNFR